MRNLGPKRYTRVFRSCVICGEIWTGSSNKEPIHAACRATELVARIVHFVDRFELRWRKRA